MDKDELVRKLLEAPPHVRSMLLDVQIALLAPLLRSIDARAVVVLNTQEPDGTSEHANGLYIIAVNAEPEDVGVMLFAAGQACGGALATTHIPGPLQ